jgi:hypothetical protein
MNELQATTDNQLRMNELQTTENRGGEGVPGAAIPNSGKRYRYSFIIRAQVGQSWLFHESQM